MIFSQPVAALEALRPQIEPLANALLVRPAPQSFAQALGNAIDALSGSLDRADALSVSAASRPAEIADAAIARARADVMLEVAAVAAAKVSGAIGQLLQTQL
jgi:flagellar hook-basal body complex protein FliE